MQEETKQVTVALSVEVDAKLTSEEVAQHLEESLTHLQDRAVKISEVVVRTVPRLSGDPAGGYESRLWEKATCRLRDPLEKLDAPVLEIPDIGQDIANLESQIAELTRNLQAVKRRLGQ